MTITEWAMWVYYGALLVTFCYLGGERECCELCRRGLRKWRHNDDEAPFLVCNHCDPKYGVP